MTGHVTVEFLDRDALAAVEGLPPAHRAAAWELLGLLGASPRLGRLLEHAGPEQMRALTVVAAAAVAGTGRVACRVVYRLLPDDERPERAQVIWAADEADLGVLRQAARRLGGRAGPDAWPPPSR